MSYLLAKQQQHQGQKLERTDSSDDLSETSTSSNETTTEGSDRRLSMIGVVSCEENVPWDEKRYYFQGTLVKRGKQVKSWKKRFFIIDKNSVARYYSKAYDTTTEKGFFQVRGCKFHETHEFEKKRFCLKIKLLDRDFYVHALSRRDLEQFKKSLTNAGGVELLNEEGVSPLEKKEVATWSHEDVLDWLQSVRLIVDPSNGFVTMESVFGSIVEKEKFDGARLIDLTKGDLERHFNHDNNLVVQCIWQEIQLLKSRKFFSKNKFKISQKFERLFRDSDLSDLDDIIKEFSDKDIFKKIYLNCDDIINTEDTLKAVQEEEGTKVFANDSYDISVDLDRLRRYKKLTKLKVQLVICELSPIEALKNVRKVISPIVSKIPQLKPQFGIFHTALVIGPFYLEWNNSSLCIPKRLAAGMSILSADLGQVYSPTGNPNEVFDKVADVIFNWNLNYHYKMASITGKKSFEGNCQDFVEAILIALGVNPTFDGALKEYLSEMKTKGTCEPVFKPSAEFAKKFHLEKPSYTFSTHEELDVFVQYLQETMGAWNSFYPYEYILLKGFDRAFWLRHFSFPDNSKYKPMLGEEQLTCCCFKDPRDTGSLMNGGIQ